jgi:hypothetical protein
MTGVTIILVADVALAAFAIWVALFGEGMTGVTIILVAAVALAAFAIWVASRD